MRSKNILENTGYRLQATHGTPGPAAGHRERQNLKTPGAPGHAPRLAGAGGTFDGATRAWLSVERVDRVDSVDDMHLAADSPQDQGGNRNAPAGVRA
jgi:hypothetical protein